MRRTSAFPAVCLSAAFLVACDGGPPSSAPTSVAPLLRQNSVYSDLYDFNDTNGAKPLAGLINVGRTLYGTTPSGGGYGHGTVFKITTSGVETVLHNFKNSYDSGPNAALINVSGTLYGTAVGNLAGGGTVFKITTSGTETVLHSCDHFGAYPYAGLLDLQNILYGTTENGGAHGYGTVFSVTP